MQQSSRVHHTTSAPSGVFLSVFPRLGLPIHSDWSHSPAVGVTRDLVGSRRVAMYSVLKSGKGATGEQTLARLNEQCNRLLRATEADVEHGELNRCRRSEPGPHDPVFGIPKPGEDLWMVRKGEDGVGSGDPRARDGDKKGTGSDLAPAAVGIPKNLGDAGAQPRTGQALAVERIEEDDGWWPRGQAGTEDANPGPI